MPGSYAPPAYNALVVTLVGGYVVPTYAEVNVVLGVVPNPPRASPALYASVRVAYQGAKSRAVPPCDSRWAPLKTRERLASTRWFSALPCASLTTAAWGVSVPVDAMAGITSDFPAAVDTLHVAAWQTVKVADERVRSRWRATHDSVQASAAAPWAQVYRIDDREIAEWRGAWLPATIYTPPYAEYRPPGATSVAAMLVAGYTPPTRDAVDSLLALGGQDPRVVMRGDRANMLSTWGMPIPSAVAVIIRWGRGAQHRRPDPPPWDSGWTGSPTEPPPIPIARRVYIIMNDVSVVRLPERTPIHVLAVDLNASVDAWCWSARLELADPSQIPLLAPDGNGPKVVEITMNSYVWTIVIEGRDSSREHANASATVTGRSQTALLADTYTAKRSRAVTDGYSAQQLALQEITDRALPFTIDWQGLDWVVPGGVWYYQDLAPIDVISQIAAARGAVVQSHPSDPSLIVQSRYPVSPWAWSAGAADVALPVDWVTNISAQQQSKPMYDAVIIAGQAQGVLAKVTRQASAGQTFAAQVVDQLIVTPQVATERGRNVLADRGMQEQVGLDIPLFAPGTITAGMSGLYAPLLLVDVQDPDDPWQGQSVGVSISARRAGPDNKALEVWQRVSLERHLSDAH